MEENRNMSNNNSSENEVVEATQQPQQTEDWKDEVKDFREINEELHETIDGVKEILNEPGMPKSKFGKACYLLLVLAVVAGIGAAVWHFGRQAVYTVASQFVFLKPSDEEILDAATQEAEKLIEEKDLPWACELDPDSVEVNYLGELKKSCEGSSEEPSKHYEYSVKFVYNVDLPDGDDREPTIRFDDFKISYGEGHYSVIKPELIVFPDKSYNSDYISKEELGDALDELGDIFDNMVNDADEQVSGNSGSSSNDYSGEYVDENIPFYYTDEDLITWARTEYENWFHDVGNNEDVLRFPDDGHCCYMGINALGTYEDHPEEFNGCTEAEHGYYAVAFEVFDELYPDDVIKVQMYVAVCNKNDNNAHIISPEMTNLNDEPEGREWTDTFFNAIRENYGADDARLEYLSSGY